MGLTLVTAATATPVSLAEAKAWCRIEDSASDTVIETLLASATAQIENLTGRALGAQTWDLTLDEFSDAIELPKGPVLSITSVTYLDENGLTQTVDSAVYTTDLVSDPQWIVRNSEESWPTVMDRVNAVTVRFSTGYASCPAPLKEAVMRLVAQAYDNRDMSEVPARVLELVQPYRAGWFAA